MLSNQDTLVLVTGGTGYIALHIISQLLADGYRVRATVRDPSNASRTKPIMDLKGASPETVELVSLDLLGDQEQFDKAAKGCDYVLHTASPFPAESPKDEMELIKPAKEGTLKMLKACSNVGGVKRVVVTSSVVAIYCNDWNESMEPMDETWWSKPEKCGAYEKSKLVAEQSAWEYVKSLPEESAFEMATINPGFVLGPMLSSAVSTSTGFLKRFLAKEFPMLPHIYLTSVDVRDVAKLHLLAMTSEKAAGERFLAGEGVYTIKDIAQLTKDEMSQYGYNFSTRSMPWFLAKCLSFFVPAVALLIPQWGEKRQTTGAKAERTFDGFKYRDIKTTVADMAHATIERGIYKKTPKYEAAFKDKPYSASHNM